jgi:phage shock protein C
MRIAELFTERLNPAGQVITMHDVEEAIKVMGDPQEISGADEQPRGARERTYGPRRLYRDPDDRMIGGVCGGLAAYLGLDPVIVRILFILFLIFGIGFLVYLILWIVVPEARTTAQKLEMRGDTVNASNIGKFVQDEIESVKRSFRRKKK